ncbi:hypothetical protein, partial [Kitasatospora aureofaciens]|uniref:hypothetical protein n=1 Tax=Kitasatospora aureofaciens TaxID=1894 RepID=UPI003CC7E825
MAGAVAGVELEVVVGVDAGDAELAGAGEVACHDGVEVRPEAVGAEHRDGRAADVAGAVAGVELEVVVGVDTGDAELAGAGEVACGDGLETRPQSARPQHGDAG